jgi:uncharacterized membrane protein
MFLEPAKRDMLTTAPGWEMSLMKLQYTWRYVIIVFALLGATSVLAQEYNVVDLGVLPSYNSSINPGGSTGVGINNAGQATGTSAIGVNTNAVTHSFYWNGSTLTDLDSPSSNTTLIASAINTGGTITGTTESGRGFTWTSSGGLNTLALPSGEIYGTNPVDASAFGINAAGDVVGQATDESGELVEAAVWRANGVSSILSPEGAQFYSTANAINSSRTIVGKSFGDGTQEATMWVYNSGTDSWTAQTVGLTGTLGGTSGLANAINTAGDIVGQSARTPGNGIGAFIWHPGDTALTDLDPTDAFGNASANGINNSNFVVGNLGSRGAFIWDATDGMQNLQNLISAGNFTLSGAAGINDSGDIIATAADSADGLPHAVILTPIPEPATAVVALAGLSCLLIRTRKNTRHRD